MSAYPDAVSGSPEPMTPAERAELAGLRKDQQAAALVQRRMHPLRLQKLEAYELRCELWPADTLSGDFIDCVALDTGGYAFLVADVAGHGTAAALVTVLLRSFMQRSARGNEQDGPAQWLAHLNAELMQLDLDRHVCALCGMLDTQNHVLRLSSAGAFPLPLLTVQGQASWALEASGKALGLFTDARFETQELAFAVGDRLTVVTDGAFDLLDGTLAEKEAALTQAAARGSEQFWEAFGRAPATGGKDDVSLLILERQAEPAQ